MKLLHKIWIFWIGLWTAVDTIVLFPLLIISVSSKKFFPFFGIMAKIWSYWIILFSGFWYKIEGKQNLNKNKQFIIVANHGSWLDIPLTYITVPNPIMFIGKKEFAKIPFFGPIYKASNILVDRSSVASRGKIVKEAEKMLKKGRSICIYPEGTTKKKGFLTKFQDGAFNLAIECGVPILPITFLDNQMKFPSNFSKVAPGKLSIIVDKEIDTSSYSLEQKEELKQKVWNVLNSNLEKHLNKKVSF